MRFKNRPQLPGAGRTRAGHHHGSDTPTSPKAIYVLKSAKCNEIMPSVYLVKDYNATLIFFPAWTVGKRHLILENSIGTMTIENEAFKTIQMIVSVTLIILSLGPVLSIYLFKWINTSLHPYYVIIEEEVKAEKGCGC